MISVIIPAYNAEKYLCESVNSALQQTHRDIEIIIIDDKSSDNTLSIASSLADHDRRVKILSNPQNLGVANARNAGIAAATGDYIAFLDADDIWVPDKLAKQLNKLESEKLDLCYTAYGFIDAEGNPFGKLYRVPEKISFAELLKENVIGCSTVLFRRKLSEHTKMRAEYSHEDYVFWLELLRGGAGAGGIDEPLMLYRKTAGGRSFNKFNSAKNRFKIYRDFLGMRIPASVICLVSYAVHGVKKHWL